MTMPAAMNFSRLKKKVFWPLFEKANLSRAGALHALSVVEAESIRALGIKSPVVQIGNGVDIPAATVSQKENTETADGVRTLLYLGRIHPIKGLNKLIDAWKLMHVSDQKWCLRIVGWGEDEHVQQFEQQIAGVDSIHFAGPLFGDQKHRAMSKASAFVLPSSSEAFPMALMEAWSHGLPAIATKTCNVIGDQGETAAVFVDDSVESIRNGISEIIEMSDMQRQEMGDRARAIVKAGYSWPSIASKFLSVYRWLLGEGPEPAELMFD
jgi:poly(glycerol-phosphate) alpha-glucosyltransferase